MATIERGHSYGVIHRAWLALGAVFLGEGSAAFSRGQTVPVELFEIALQLGTRLNAFHLADFGEVVTPNGVGAGRAAFGFRRLSHA